ncbi:(Fe-S)-binding protein [Ferrovibrio sp.]|uniref:(Fe-S)-binding protein n=1 Tax=Ferrovibrio sp. TaxID=1917215 RepID=UPI001B6D67B4|nr:(Fe-S)-binding protein [Ferrovibrio sp.]MBP7062943.1 (Fe-S)-binding protein [Ferrovibrio sp.]
MTQHAFPAAPAERPQNPRVALFVTCLVDLFRPSVGFSAVQLLENAGCRVEVPEAQVCCGQPAYNSGDRKDTAAIARQVIQVFEGYDFIVAPSGSCAGMLREHYPALFAGDAAQQARAEAFAAKVWELTSFLADVLRVEAVAASLPGETRIAYHDSCSGLRELGIKAQPRQLLAGVTGANLVELEGAETCCGFGGTFCVKYGEVSADIAGRKTAQIAASGADLLLAGDMGCLMNMAGKLKREGSRVQVRHVAEVLAGMTQAPAIGEASEG